MTELTQPGTDPGTATAADDSRARAARIVASVADRLADPRQVVAAATAAGNVDDLPNRPPAAPWSPLSLSEGHTGVALLFAELSRTDAGYRAAAHAQLSAAAQHPTAPSGGLYGGWNSLAFTAWAARRSPTDYARLLDRVDERVTASLADTLAEERRRLTAGRAGAPMHAYDVVSGVAGRARYLLLRQPRHPEALTQALSYLVQLTEPVRVHGRTVPGWWVPGGPGSVGPDPHYPRGHLNLGLAHGVPGPLALLALAWQARVRVPGHEVALTRIAEWLLSWRTADGQWPWIVSFERHEARDAAATPLPPARVAWCYGTPGVARALYLAGAALSRQDWQRAAVDALVTALSEIRGPIEGSLCHGWAGVLHSTWRMARDSGDPRLLARLPYLATRVMDAYDPELPFGFGYASPARAPRVARDRAGFLDGAAGIALALHTHATDTVPAARWDAALLLS